MLRLTLFGPPQLKVDAAPVDLHRDKALALLAYLATTGMMHRRDHLAALLWPDYSQSSARTYLRQTFYILSKALGGQWFQSDRTTIGLHPNANVQVDVQEFQAEVEAAWAATPEVPQHLARAAALAQDEFMVGFSLRDASNFDEWQIVQRESLRRERAGVLDALVSHHLDKQEYRQAIEYACRRMALDPLHEAAHRTLMLLYALSGQKASAQRQYAECARLLQDEMGVQPGGDTTMLFEAIQTNRIGTSPIADAETALFEAVRVRTQEKRPASDGKSGVVTVAPAASIRHNLPSQLTSLVGRQAELAQIAHSLSAADCRLLTIWGLGGIGKTRLALAAAEEQLGSCLFPDGVFHVPLVSLSRPEQTVPTVAASMDFPLDSAGGNHRRSPLQQLLDFLRVKRLLLVLDNLEHLPEVVELITEILQTAKGVKILATSRERLRLPGEQVYPLAGLDYPTSGRDDDVCGYSALQLFIDRASHCRPGFGPGDAEKDDLVRICQVVDGMPLAIELAAAWVDTLALGEIRQELDENMGILATDAQGIPGRHRSVGVAFDASWQRLNSGEQQVFAQLSVFRGGFTRDAAEQVAGASLRLLSNLVGKSFVRFDPNYGRYDIHELLRQYGAEKLGEQAEDETATRDRHAAYFCEYLQQRHEELKGSRQRNALLELDMERGNLQVAWERITTQHDLARVEQTMDGLGRFYEWTGNLTGGAAAFAVVADDVGYRSSAQAQKVQAHALAWLGNFELLSGHTEAAEQQLKRSIEILDDLADLGEDVQREKALALLHRGNLDLPRNLESAIDAYIHSCGYFEGAGLRWEAVIAKSWLGKAHQILHHEQAIELLSEARDGLEALGDRRSVARVLEDIAIYYLLNQPNLETALETAQASLELRRQNGDLLGISSSLNVVGSAYHWLGQHSAAVPVLSEALAIAQRLGHRAGECRIYLDTVSVYGSLGRLEEMQIMAERGLVLARELGQARYTHYLLLNLGKLAIIRGDYEAAHDLNSEAFDVLEKAGIPVAEPWPHTSRAYSAWKVGNMEEAREHISSALRDIAERSDTYNAVRALRFLAQVVAVQGDLDRTVEIDATAGAASIWDESLTMRAVFIEPLEKLTEGLEPEPVAAARERGCTRDLFEMVAELLEDVHDPSWRWS